MKVEFAENEHGQPFIKKFFEKQDGETRAMLIDRFERMEKYTLPQLLSAKKVSKLHLHKNTLYEIRIPWKRMAFRFLCHPYQETLWVLEAFKKTSNTTPPTHINIALERKKLFIGAL